VIINAVFAKDKLQIVLLVLVTETMIPQIALAKINIMIQELSTANVDKIYLFIN
jgi:hypothetical protein